ncbi:MAG: sugar phosphate nucleotidyltransferase, partial [Planctomycetota bacterium]
VVLGDNIIQGNIKAAVDDFAARPHGAKIMLKEVDDPQRFGVASVDHNGVVKEIVEKPKQPESNKAVIGIYMYDSKVFDYIRGLKPSDRGELEITDVNNAYINAGEMTADVLQGWWTDAGTFDSLRRASNMVAEGGANNLDM